MVGAQMLPQTKVIPQVDLVISHGGNNTVTETLHFGKPLIVLPLFWDQYENAQRIDELGFGVRLDTYAFADAELTDAVDRLLADTDLRARLADIGAAIRGRDGLRVGADVIEQVGVHAPSLRLLEPLDALDLADGKRLVDRRRRRRSGRGPAGARRRRAVAARSSRATASRRPC